MQQETLTKKMKPQVELLQKPVRIPEQFLVKPEPKFFTVEALRSYMESVYGYSLSKSRIYALTMNSEIPHIKGPGGRLLFPIAEIPGWIEGETEKKEGV